jgi:hypothetical protein
MKKLLFGLLVILLLIGTIGCGGEEATYQVYSGLNGDTGVTRTPAPTTMAVPAPTLVSSPSKGGASYETNTSTAGVDRMVIRSASLTLVVNDVANSLSQITDLAAIYGGYVVNSNIGEDQNRLYAYISFRVLSTRFNDTIQALRKIAADVKSESTSGQDVTEDYTDLAAKLRNLEASEMQLLELMKQAGTVEEILAVQKELVNTREQIEVTKGRMQYLEQSSNLALFTVTLEQSKLIVNFTAESRSVKEGNSVQFLANVSGGFSPYTYEWNFGDDETSTEPNPAHAYRSAGTFTVTLKVTDDKGVSDENIREDYIMVLAGWNAGSIVGSAWDALVGFGHFLSALFIGLGIFSPVWIVILVILYFAWWRRRKRKA